MFFTATDHCGSLPAFSRPTNRTVEQIHDSQTVGQVHKTDGGELLGRIKWLFISTQLLFLLGGGLGRGKA